MCYFCNRVQIITMQCNKFKILLFVNRYLNIIIYKLFCYTFVFIVHSHQFIRSRTELNIICVLKFIMDTYMVISIFLSCETKK